MNHLIGDTPIVKIKYRYHDHVSEVYCKLEQYNLTGSIKDRVAEYILKSAEETGDLKEGMPIIEATSGNTGISFAALGARKNHPVIIYMPDWVSMERQKLMKLYGAEVKLISKEEGGFQACIEQADQLSKETKGFRPNQFSNEKNVEAHYMTTGYEIVKQIHEPIGGFTSGIGTGGTLMGIGKRLKETWKDVKIVALEPKELPMLSGYTGIGSHKIEGIGDDFIPEIVDSSIIDDVVLIHDDDAVMMSYRLSSKLGLGVGISSGANFLSAVLLKEKCKQAVVTIFPDDAKKYLTTDLLKTENLSVSPWVNDIVLLEYEIV